MKKMILTLLLVFYTAIGFSQVLFESFENTTGPDPSPSTNWTLGSGNWAVFDTNVGGTVNWSINSNSYSGANCAYMNRQNIGMGITSEEYLATPSFTVPANGEISFYSRTFISGNQGTIYQVKITSAGNQTNPSAYTTLLAEFNEDQLSSYFSNYEEKIVDLSAFAGNQVHIAFVKKYTQPYAGISGDRWLLDNVMIQSHPTCSKPIDLVASNITPTSVTLDWTDTTGASSWEVIASISGTTAVTPTSVGIVTNAHPFTFTNLDPYTAYSFFVRAICSPTEKSNWSLAKSIITSQVCQQPSNMTYSNVGETTATIAWTENGTATSWEIVALPFGTILTSATTGVITSSNPYIFTNLVPDTSYNFYVRAICSPNEISFWVEDNFSLTTLPPPVTCGGYFTDNGGASFNYTNNSNYTYTICPDNPNDVVTITFTQFSTEVNFDGLYIYNGNNTSQPILSGNGPGFGDLTSPGAFWGNLNSNLPGPITSTAPDGCLTFRFISDGSVTNSGWKANVSCGDGDSINLIAFVDSNGNGIKDVDENNFTYGSFSYDENNTGNPTSVYTPYGYYIIYDTVGGTSYDFSYEIQSEYLPYYSLGSISNYNDITIANGSGPQTFYFPITLIQSYTDLSITGTTNGAVAGNYSIVSIRCKNYGLTSASGTISFVKPPQTTIDGIYPLDAILDATGFTYSFTNLPPNESLNLNIYLAVPPIPTVSIGDFLVSSVSVTGSSNEANLVNNNFEISTIISASYDPNDKTESHGGIIEIDDFTNDDYLYYTIRFENTGTAPASNIRIEDNLDTRLDETTVRMVSSSHYNVMSRQSNHLIWNFNNIQLPVTDYPNSNIGQGFVTFKVKPKSGYAVGDIIPNTAEIYFDSNPAIVTNTFNTEFVQALGTTSFASNNVLLYPNPSYSSIQVSLQNSTETMDLISITDVSGKNIRNLKSIQSNQLTIDVSELAKGIYFVEIITQNGLKQTKKLIKE